MDDRIKLLLACDFNVICKPAIEITVYASQYKLFHKNLIINTIKTLTAICINIVSLYAFLHIFNILNKTRFDFINL